MNLDHAIRVKERHEGNLLKRDFVQGVGVGEDRGQPAIKVYVDRPTVGTDLPKYLEGIPVVVEVSGLFRSA